MTPCIILIVAIIYYAGYSQAVINYKEDCRVTRTAPRWVHKVVLLVFVRFFDYTEFGIPQFPVTISRRD